MDVIAKLKEKLLEHIIAVILALIALLSLVVWRAVPSSIWDNISEATPKRVLWALLGLEGIAICSLVALAVNNRRKRKDTPPPKPQYFRIFGLFWDYDLNPLCPADEILLFVGMSGTRAGDKTYDILRCPKCGTDFPLRDDVQGACKSP